MQREPDFIFERQTGGSFLPRSRSAPPPARKVSANQPLELLALEDRVLYSAVPIDLPDAAPNEPCEPNNLEQQVNDLIHWTSLLAAADLVEPGANSETIEPIGPAASEAGGTILVVVDQGIADHQTLLHDIQNQLPQQHSLLLIDSTGDGWLQLNQYLSQHQGIQQVHLFSHAASGQLLLGNQSLQIDDLFNDDSAAIWQRALQLDADVFLYGCQLAADSVGEQFVSQFAMFSGADVAASVDQTGNAPGADWDLEFSVGLLNSDSLFSDDNPLHWEGTLDPQTFLRSGVQELSGIDRGSTSAVAVDVNGSYVIVWSEQVSGNGWDVFACRFNADGTQNGSVFTVNQSTTGDERYASVDMDSSGRFIITWTGIDNGNDGILARLYAANGTALTGEFIVNTYLPAAQFNSSVSMAQDGRFVIAWEGKGTEDSQGIYAQRYDANANAIGSQIFVNGTVAGAQENPTVSMNSSGAFVVGWNDETSFRYQRFDSNGNRLDQNGVAAAEMTVSAIGTARHGDILLNHDGTVVSTWQEYAGGFWDVYFQKDAVNGTALISKSLVLTNDTTDQLAPSIDGSGSGEFIITWKGRETGDLDGGVFYRLYTATGLATPYTFLANGNYTTSQQGLASVAATSLENYVVVWSGNSAADTSDIGHNNVRNMIPVGVNDSTSLAEAGGYGNSGIGSLLPVNVLFNDTDAGDTLAVVGVVQGAGGISTSNVGSPLAGTYGALTLAADGTVSYSLNQLNASVQALRTSANTLTETFTYTVRDSGNMVSTATLTITITGQNDAPTAVSDTATAVEASGVSNGTAGTNPTGNVLTNDTDPDSGDTKSVTGVAAGVQASATGNVGTAVTGTYGSINISSAGAYTYTVDNNNSAVQALRTSSNTLTETFTYTMSDTAGLTSTAQITITIQGANDTPTVNFLTSPNIAENSANGTVVTNASAMEVDSGDTATFSLSNNAGGRFAINSSTGEITVANSILLNYEAATNHAITIRVTDSSSAFHERNLTINLTDVNEFPLSAVSDNNAASNTIAENAANGSAVGITARATDGDSLATITYSLLDNAGGRFAINSATGVVTKAGTLDFETATSHTITVQASSSDGATSTADFVISVTDFNEFAPTVPVDNNPAVNEVVENSAAGTLVGITASSVDNDGSNNTITYSLTDSASGRFTIDSNTGVVTLTSLSVNYEQATSHNITVRATSSVGTFSSQTFTINVLNGGNEISGISDLNVLADTMAENALLGSSVITAFASHPDGLAITYSLTSDGGGKFAIDSSTGVVSLISSLNYEVATSHLITVRADASDGSFATHSYTITVQDIDEFDVGPVTDNNGASNSIAENSANGATVGLTARATDADGTTNTITYSLDDNAGGRFAINSSTGVVTVANGTLLDFETATSHTIVVRATSADSSFSTASFTINVTNVNEAPTITNNATHTLTSTNEDTPSSGTLASVILSGVNWADVDASALNGLAITSKTGSGTWQFSTDGATWTSFGAVTGTNALLITSTTQVRYTPSTQNAETATFTFKAWDRTTGTASTNGTARYASTASSGGSTAYSASNATASMSVTAVNDAPTITNNATHTLASTNEDATSSGTLASAILTGVSWADVDTGAVSGLAITSVTGSGTWQYSTDGVTWADFGTVSSTNALLITSSTRVRYTPNTQNAETATFTFKAWDQTSGTASTNSLASYTSVASAGLTTAFSASNATASMSVTAVNDAPTITNSATHTLSSTTEDAASSGTLASAILSGVSWGDVDTGALSGLAITGVTGSGTWQYSTNGTTWANFGSVSSTSALLITSSTQVRYSPNTQNSETATFTFKAWDQTSGTASTNTTASYASTATTGGTTAFSTSNATASISVTALNDAPTITNASSYSFTSVNEDTTSAGALASTILTNASWADVDTGAISGMAITGLTGLGTWQYSTDGTTWANFGSVSSSNSLLLNSTSQIRYIPNSQNGETATFTYKAWDQTSGTASTNTTANYASTSTPGGTTAFSINNATGQIVVTSVNDAPTMTDGSSYSFGSINEDTTSAGVLASTILTGANWGDVDTSASSGMAITNATGLGTWQYSTDGSTWANFGAVSSTNALLITSTSQIRYIPNSQNGELASFTYKAWDRTSGIASTNATPSYATTATAGGTTAFSASDASASINVTAVNDAPNAVNDTAVAAEAGGVNNATAGSNPSGNVLTNDTDPDTGDLKTVTGVAAGAISSATGNVATAVPGNYGSITIASNGTYTYTVDNSNAAVQALRTSANTLLDTFTYTITDGGGLTSTTQITITIQGANDAPHDLATTGLTVAENAANGTSVGTITRSDVDTGDGATYSLVDSAGGRFAINSSTGVVTVANGTLLNRENAASHNITIRVTDTAGATYDEVMTVTITDVDEFDVGVISDSNIAANSIAENSVNGSLVGITASASDADATNNTITFSLDDSAGGRFAINSSTGVVTVADGSLLNFEAATSHNITIRATSADGSSSTQIFTINLSNQNEGPTAVNDSAVAVEAGGVANATPGSNPSGNVLANDLDPDSGDTRLVIGVATGTPPSALGLVGTSLAGQYGTLVLNADGSYNFTLDNSNPAVQSLRTAGDALVDTFTYTMQDGAGLQSTARLSILITGVNDNPTTQWSEAGLAINSGSSNNQYVQLQDFDDLIANRSQFTVRVSLSTTQSTFFLLSYATTSEHNEFRIYAFGGTLRLSFRGSDWNTNVSSNLVTDGNRHELAVTRDAGLGQLKLFIDGNLVAADLSISPGSNLQANGVAILAEEQDVVGGSFNSSQFFRGTLWDLSVYDTAWSNSRVANEFGIVSSSASDLRGHWNFNDIVSNQIIDSVGNRNGTLNTISGGGWVAGTPSITRTDWIKSINEHSANGLTIAVLNASELDAGDTLTWSLSDDAGGRFSINASTGEVTIANSSLVDRETAASFQITAVATDTAGGTHTRTYTIQLNDVDEFDVSPVVDGNTTLNQVGENATNGSLVGLTAQAFDADATNNTITYSLTNSAGGRFAINSSTGVVTVANGSLLNQENAASHTITVRATSADGSISTQSFTINVIDVDEFDVGPISDLNPATNSVNENAAVGTDAGITANATDADATNSNVTYSLDNSAGGRFAIDAVTGVVTVADSGLLDREAASSHSIIVRATSEDGSFTTQSYSINLNDLDEFDITTPVDADSGSNQVSEGAANGTTVGLTATAIDADVTTNAITWTLDDDAGGRFAINPSTGVVTVANGALLDREVATSHAITIRATSADGSTAISTFQIQIDNVNESPIAVADTAIATEAGGLSNSTPGSNPTGNVLLNDSDIDSGDTRVVVGVQAGVQSSTAGSVGSVISGLYGSLTLNSDGSYTYTVDNANPQVEALRNSSAQLVDTFSYTIRDAAGLESTTQLAVTVQGANDTPHSMWSETGLALNSSASNNQYLQIENLGNLLSSAEFTLRISITTTQSGPHILSYATAAHHNELRISTASSKLQVHLNGQSWTTSIPRSLLTDGDRHELCLVRTVADGGLIVFIDGVQKDSITGFKTGVQLGIGGSLVLGQEQDTVGGSFDSNQIFRGTYWDLSVHSTAWSSGRVHLNTGHTFHDLPDLRGHWDFELSGGDTVFDQIGTRHAGLRSIPAGGSWVAGTATQVQADWKPNLVENAANGTLVSTLRAAEVDQGGQLTWSLVDNAGGRFAIDANTGQITVADSAGINFEHLQTHQIIVRVTDEGGLSREETYQIRLTDVQESDVSIPVDDNPAPNFILENSTNGALVGLTAWAIDQDGTTNRVTYSLDENAGGRFAINSSTGVVTVANGSLLDREAAASHSIVVRATSEDGTTAIREFTIAVGDISEFPIGPISDTNSSDNVLPENATTGTLAGITARASDPDATNNTVRYSLDDSAGGRFVIDENTGVVTVVGDGLFDYESLTSMSIIVRASSSDGSFVTQSFVINLIDVDEFDTGPISDFDTTDNLVYENSEIGTYTGLTAFARDADATNNGITYRLLDDDGGRFSIDSSTGRVLTYAPLDFEVDGQFRTIQVSAVSEDGSSTIRNFTLEIADVYKETFSTYAGLDVEFSPTEILASSRDENYEITNLTLENAPAFGDLIVVSSTGSRIVSSRDLSSLLISSNEKLRFIAPATTQGNITLGYTAMNGTGMERTGTVTILVEAAAPPAPPPSTTSFTSSNSGSTSSSERAPSNNSPSGSSVVEQQDATATSSSGGEASGSAAGGAVMAVGPISGSGGPAGAAFEFAEEGETSERKADTGAGKASGDANQQADKTSGESGLFTSVANLMQNSNAESFVASADSGVVTRVFATAAAIEQKLTNSTQFIEYLSKLETALQQTPVVVGFEMPAYASAGASLFTVGYVAWVIRGGVLLTSFMSSLPSWQSFDPLPILENAGSGDGDYGADGSDSSIAELVDSEQPVPSMSGTAG